MLVDDAEREPMASMLEATAEAGHVVTYVVGVRPSDRSPGCWAAPAARPRRARRAVGSARRLPAPPEVERGLGGDPRLVDAGPRRIVSTAARARHRRPARAVPTYREHDRAAADVVLSMKPSLHAFAWPYPAVFPIHDVQHLFLFQPWFPELGAHGELARRAYVFENGIARARAVGSATCRERVGRGVRARCSGRAYANRRPGTVRAGIGVRRLERRDARGPPAKPV